MNIRLSSALSRTKAALNKITADIKHVDNQSDSNRAIIQVLEQFAADTQAIFDGSAGESPFVNTNKIKADLQGERPTDQFVVSAGAVWDLNEKLKSIISALSGFDGDADPNDAIANLNTVMEWAELNTDKLNAMAPATPTVPGFMSATQASRLASVAEGATRNVVSPDPASNSADTVPSSSALKSVKDTADEANIPAITPEEMDAPDTVLEERKFSPKDLMDFIRKNAAVILRDVMYSRTILIPGTATEGTFPSKLVVPAGSFTGRVTLQSSNSAGGVTVRLTHTDTTTVVLNHSGPDTIITDVSLKAGSWTISLENIVVAAAEDLFIYIDLIAD